MFDLKVGITTEEIDRFVHSETIKANAYPSPLRYAAFPKSVCTSVNNVVCHGIPDDRPLVDGDIINIDVTVNAPTVKLSSSFSPILRNVLCRLSRSITTDITEIARKHSWWVTSMKRADFWSMLLKNVYTKRLVSAVQVSRCKKSEPASKNMPRQMDFQWLLNSLAMALASTSMGRHQFAIIVSDRRLVSSQRTFQNRTFSFSTANAYPGVMLTGMTFTIEPILSLGSSRFRVLEDEWTAVTRDNSRTAQFEHTILITNKGCEVLTIPDE